MMTKDWIRNTNIYEVNLRQYTAEGTFMAFLKHLPRLKDMGVETLWFMPVTPISETGKKGSLGSYYACSDYTAVNAEFGTAQELILLIQECHKVGFRVLLDWVANHTGWDHRWTREHPEWYRRDEATGGFKKATGMDDIIELDFANPVMRKEMIDAMKFWVEEYGIDGFRCDLASWVPLDFWVQAKEETEKIKPLFWLAEADALTHPEYMQVFDAAYTWKWMHDTERFFKEEISLTQLLQVLADYRQAPGIQTWFTTNHDENSWNGTEFEKYGDMAKVLAVFSCTWPGVPLIYSGQELPNRKRLKFFDKDPIEWEGTFALHDFYRTLLHTRSASRMFSADSGFFRVHTTHDMFLLGYMRKHNTEEAVVFLNFSGTKHLFTPADGWLKGTYRNIFTHHEVWIEKGELLEIAPWDAAVFVGIS